jgi:predicted cobalt transporter CbtA
MRLLRDVGAGIVAGAIGTSAMDLLLYARYRRDGGKDSLWRWEFAGNVMSWDEASAPGQLARKAWHRATGHEPSDDWARAATNTVHWATGVGWGLAYSALASTTSRRPWTRAFALGPIVWTSGYVLLPLAKVYKPIWKYDARTLAKDLSAHVLYGTAVSVAYWALAREEP